MLLTLILLLICIPLTIWFGIGIIYQSAKNNRQLTFNNTGEIKFVVEGGKIVRIIMDVPGKVYNATADLIEEPSAAVPDKPLGKFHAWIKKKIASRYGDSQPGIAYVSILYPLVRVLTWRFHWSKLEPQTKKEGAQDKILEKYSIIERDEEVSSLYYEYTYPVLVKDIELKGNFTINILINVILRVRKPLYLIGSLKGKFMPQVVTEISGLVDNGLREASIESWRREDKEKMIDGFFKEEKGGKKILNEAFEVAEVSYVMFDYSGNSEDVIKAITLDQIAAEKGKAKVTEKTADAIAAEKEKEADILRGQGKAQAILDRMSAAASVPGGLDAYKAELQSEAIKEYSGGTLVLNGGGNTLVSVPTTDRPKETS